MAKTKNWRNKVFTFLKGMGMGAADVVPGVSGGTIAFITGIYERLISALNSIDGQAVKLFFTLQFKILFRKIDGIFLITLFAGVFFSILTLAKLIQYLLTFHRVYLWAFFFGLIIASVWVIARKIPRWHAVLFAWLFSGVFIAYIITATGMISMPHTLGYIFLSGMVSIMAMILPGISGSYILLILGKYEYIIGSLTRIIDYPRNTAAGFPLDASLTMLVFGTGAVIGLLSFAKLLKWLFNRYHDMTIALLTGFMIGSLNKIWPWKITVSSFVDRHGEVRPLVEQNILPGEFNFEVFAVILLAISGFAVVYFVELLAEKFTNIENRI